MVPRISKFIDHEENAAGLSSQTATDSAPRLFKQKSDIASSGSMLKILASVFQLLFSYYTVYQHGGDQIQRWGYVSFFFTPLPYAIMSFCNGISNLLTPDYARLYMVHSEIMDEAEEAGGAFDGVVGRVIPLTGPVDDNGYRSGFASTWKGLSPTSIKRVFATALLRARKKRGSPRTPIPATCTAFSRQADNSYLLHLHIQSGENDVGSVYKVIPKSESASDGQFFDDTSVLTKTTMDERLAQLKSSSAFLIYYPIYCCICHPQRTWRYLKKQNRNPKMPKAIGHPFILLVCGIGLLIWSVFHPQRAGRTVRQWFHRLRKLLGTWYRLPIPRLPAHKVLPRKIMQNTVYYQSCARFQRYDDPIPQKHISAAITNTTRIIGAPTTIDINYAAASSPREIADVTWSSIVLPVSFGLVLSAIPIIIIAALSHFHPGSSSSKQRIIMLLWWSSGSILGLLMPLLDVSEILVCIIWLPSYMLEKLQDSSLYPYGVGVHPAYITALAYIPWSIFVAPVWGYVIVGQMLGEWGSCISLY